MIIGRSAVIAGKYGRFKPNYWMLFRETFIPTDIFNRESVASVEGEVGDKLNGYLLEHFKKL